MPHMFDVHAFKGRRDGPSLLVLGAVHGNETCGTTGMLRLLGELARKEVQVLRGALSLVPVVNRLAFNKGQRGADRNLNRNLAPTSAPKDNEDLIANELCPLITEHDVLLDLHSFQSGHLPFVLVGPENNEGSLQPFSRAQEEEAFARALGVDRAVDGWLETYAAGAVARSGQPRYGVGTTEYMRSVGGYAVTVECGQHDDPQAVEAAHNAILNALATLGMVDAPPPAPVDMECIHLVQVVDRAHLGDRFTRAWQSFDPTSVGQTIAVRANGEDIVAPGDGRIVFPNAEATPGNEWFYFAKQSARFSTRVT